MNKIIKLALTDFKLIFRDTTLRSFLALPMVLFALIIWGVPYLVEQYDFLKPYLPLMLVVCVIENTQMFCFISGMVLIDEKENNVAQVYGITPLSRIEYIVSRFFFPYLFTVLLNEILFLIQPFYDFRWLDHILLSLLAALVVPVYVLILNIIAENRMKGLVYVKAINMVVLIPIAAFFVPEQWKLVFGLLPTHWIFQSIEGMTQNTPIGLMLMIGFAFFAGLLWICSKAFMKRHFV